MARSGGYLAREMLFYSPMPKIGLSQRTLTKSVCPLNALADGSDRAVRSVWLKEVLA